MNLLGIWLLVLASVTVTLAQQSAKDSSPSTPPKVTIEGLVRDIACPIQNFEATATHYSKKCLNECAHNGAPLGILTEDGDIYVPISDQMPDTDQRQKLLPFVGKYVQVSGVVYDRKGTRAIAIGEIKEMKDVHLTVDE
ncbi:MAG TPA: hypothetical protein VF753_02195 [Terriglobales bacterium]